MSSSQKRKQQQNSDKAGNKAGRKENSLVNYFPLKRASSTHVPPGLPLEPPNAMPHDSVAPKEEHSQPGMRGRKLPASLSSSPPSSHMPMRSSSKGHIPGRSGDPPPSRCLAGAMKSTSCVTDSYGDGGGPAPSVSQVCATSYSGSAPGKNAAVELECNSPRLSDEQVLTPMMEQCASSHKCISHAAQKFFCL